MQVILFVFLPFVVHLCSAFSTYNDVSDKPMLEPIGGTQFFRMHGRKGKDERNWIGDRERHVYCVRKARCEVLKQKTCYGSVLPYNYTSLDLTDFYSQEQTWERLYTYQAIRHVPKCWAVIQPFLCAVFLPKCEDIDGKPYVYMPSLEMCRKTQEPCRIIYNTTYFPEFLKCNPNHFPSSCNNDVREMKFNSTGQCLRPMVAADSSTSYFKDIEGCGIQCKDPRFTDKEHEQIHRTINWGASICLICNTFTILTFVINWKHSKEFPPASIFYINCCFLVVSLGWLLQVIFGSESIACKQDGTVRQNEPSGGDNLVCLVTFVMVYYFLIAAIVWFMVLLYTTQKIFRALSKIRHAKTSKNKSQFHMIAWSLPVVLTIPIFGLSGIDGDSLTGICFVGNFNPTTRIVFLLFPTFVVFVASVIFLALTLSLIFKNSKQAGFTSLWETKKTRWTIIRMLICISLICFFIVVSFVCHVLDFVSSPLWADSLREYIICLISSTYTDVPMTCKIEHRPSGTFKNIHLLCLFGSGIVMSSWIWTQSTIETWATKLRCREVNEQKYQKHKIIAQAYDQREEFKKNGRLEISCRYPDPAGLNFDVDSAKGSYDLSSTWAQHLPLFLNRRGGFSHEQPRKNSVDSVSISICQVSVESRRNSCDSEVSIAVAQMKTKIARGKKGRSQKRRHDFSARRYSRKESSTSMESQSIVAAASLNDRRPAIDPTYFNQLLANPNIAKLLASQGLTTSEEETFPAITYDSELKRSQDRSSKNSKNSRSKKQRLKRLKKNVRTGTTSKQKEADNDDDDSFTSYFSEQQDVHSSNYSGVSLATSRNSKRSCDVGIQTNAHEIATQTMSSFEYNEKNLKNLKDEENHEYHSLLNTKKEKGIAIRKRETDMSETEKLKLLLLPSK